MSDHDGPASANGETEKRRCTECGQVAEIPVHLSLRGHCSNHPEGGKQVMWERVVE